MILRILICLCIIQCAFSTVPARYFLNSADGKFARTSLFSEEILLDFSVPLVFIIHGWIENTTNGHYVELTKAYNKIGKNVILVDWDSLAAASYLNSLANTRIVGNHLGQLLLELIGYGLNPANIHIVGHSLGAHVAGFAGKYFQKHSIMKVKRITGLDPAGWGFYKLPLFDNKMERLDENDADLVVILNTSVMFGISRPIGKVTFYANNGLFQPGCPFDDDPNTKPIFCSHQRSMSYMIESLSSKNFVGRSRCTFLTKKCQQKKLVFNEDIPCKAEGIYYFETNKMKPYGKG